MQAIQTGSNIKVTYKEPTLNADGTPLVDLDKTTVEADWGEGQREVGSVPASSLSGGAEQSVEFTVPAASGTVMTVKSVAFAYDKTGNKSLPSPEVILSVDLLAPMPPE